MKEDLIGKIFEYDGKTWEVSWIVKDKFYCKCEMQPAYYHMLLNEQTLRKYLDESYNFLFE